MNAAATIAVTVGTMATIAVAGDRAPSDRLQDLMERGFEVMAEGQLQEVVECTRWTMRVLPNGSHDSCTPKYGSFKRLRAADREYVCVSFRDWACYPSPSSN
jgi:hypothetical protein